MTRSTFVEVVIGSSDLSVKDAERILDFYIKEKLATLNAHDGYRLKHGALLDHDVLERASQASLLDSWGVPGPRDNLV